MLDAKADGERLGLDGDAAVVQHLEHVAGAVAHRQHDMVGCDLLAAFQHHAAHLAVAIEQQVGHLALKAIFAAQAFDGLAQALHHRHQPEGADMRMGLGEDFFRRAGLHEFGQHLAAQMARVLDLAVELAVGERAGAAFAELHVRFRIEHRSPPQAPGVLGALAHHLAALQDDGPKARSAPGSARRTTRTAPRRSPTGAGSPPAPWRPAGIPCRAPA